MKKLLLSFFALASISHFSSAQNVGINTTGAAPVNPVMLEVLQPSITISSAGIYVNHSGAVAGVGNYGYAIQAIKNGAGVNNVALYLRATAGTTSNIAIRMEGSTSGTLDISPAATTTSYSLTMPAAIAATSGSIFTSSTTGVLSWTPTLLVGNGGTGATTLTGILQGNGTGAFTALTGTTNYLARWTGSSPYLGIGVTRDDATSVGINAAPTATERLTVAGVGLNGINASSSLASAGAYAIQGSATGAAQTYGILGTASADVLNASGVRGYASGATAGTNGVWGESVSGAGVYGIATNANGNGIEGVNSAVAGSGTGSGILARTDQGGDGTTQAAALWGLNYNTAPLSGCGIGGYLGASAGALGFNKAGVSGACGSSIANGLGIIGACDNATGIGVQGQSAGSSGTGVYGVVSSASGAGSVGVKGNNASTVGGAVTVYGLYGQCNGTAASAGATHIGNYSFASGATYNAAAYFGDGGEVVIKNNGNSGTGPSRSWAGSIATGRNGTTATSGLLWWRDATYNWYVWSSGSADYSEFFNTTDSSLGVGEVVALDPEHANSVRRARPSDVAQTVGIVSLGGTHNNDDHDPNRKYDPNFINIGLLGQVPVLITLENGSIKPGDPLTLSIKFRGRAMKATGACRIIGYAITHFPYVDGEKDYEIDILGGSAQRLRADHVMIYLNVGWYEPNNNVALGDGVEPPAVESLHAMQKRMDATLIPSGQEEFDRRAANLKAENLKKSASVQVQALAPVPASKKVNKIEK